MLISIHLLFFYPIEREVTQFECMKSLHASTHVVYSIDAQGLSRRFTLKQLCNKFPVGPVSLKASLLNTNYDF